MSTWTLFDADRRQRRRQRNRERNNQVDNDEAGTQKPGEIPAAVVSDDVKTRTPVKAPAATAAEQSEDEGCRQDWDEQAYLRGLLPIISDQPRVISPKRKLMLCHTYQLAQA